MIELVLRIPHSHIGVDERGVHQREQSRRRPQLQLSFVCEPARKAIHEALTELHPPYGVSRLIGGANRTRNSAEALHFLECPRISPAFEPRRSRWSILSGRLQHERLRMRE